MEVDNGSKKKRRKYDAEFKEEAVRLVVDQKRTCASVEKVLGLSNGLVKGWVRSYNVNSDNAFPGNGKRRKAHESEIEQLKSDLDIARKERDILKKALAIFSMEPLRYMLS